MPSPIILSLGDRFGRLTVIARAQGPRPGTHWLCRCDCGGERIASSGELRAHPERVKSCGCARREGAARGIVALTKQLEPGQRFGRYTVIERAAGNFPGAHWRCRCDCGTERVVYGRSLRNGHTVSCGCYHKDELRRSKTTHGESVRGHWTPEFQAWACMRTRCRNPRDKWYPSYGGRGITVCEQWKAYENFLADVGRRPSPDHSLDRIDNNGNYEPGNCRWATRSEQQRNKRRYAKSPTVIRRLRRAGLL